MNVFNNFKLNQPQDVVVGHSINNGIPVEVRVHMEVGNSPIHDGYWDITISEYEQSGTQAVSGTGGTITVPHSYVTTHGLVAVANMSNALLAATKQRGYQSRMNHAVRSLVNKYCT